MKNAAPKPAQTQGWNTGRTIRKATAAGTRNNKKYAKVLKITPVLSEDYSALSAIKGNGANFPNPVEVPALKDAMSLGLK